MEMWLDIPNKEEWMPRCNIHERRELWRCPKKSWKWLKEWIVWMDYLLNGNCSTALQIVPKYKHIFQKRRHHSAVETNTTRTKCKVFVNIPFHLQVAILLQNYLNRDITEGTSTTSSPCKKKNIPYTVLAEDIETISNFYIFVGGFIWTQTQNIQVATLNLGWAP